MAQQTINVGAAPNDGTGTPLRTAFQYTNSNFTELYTAVGPSGNNIVVPGSATISGDLTVNGANGITVTNGKFATNASGQTVGLQLDSFVSGGAFNNYILNNASAAGTVSALNFGRLTSLLYGFIRTNNNSQNLQLGTSGAGSVEFFQNNSTAMTLNSTGLGVGTASLSRKFEVHGTPVTIGGTATGMLVTVANNGTAYNASPTSGLALWNKFNSSGSLFPSAAIQAGKENATDGNYAGFLSLYTVNSVGSPNEQMRIDSSGNVGIGVTPSAWGSTYRALQIGLGTSLTGITNDVDVNLVNNARFDGTNWKYTNTSPAERYRTAVGTHFWYNAASGTAGNNITWTQAMTLDASGNLLVGVTTTGNRLDVQKSTDCTVLVKSTGANANVALDYVSTYGNHTIRKNGTAVWDFGVINDASATPAFKVSNASSVGVQLVSGATSWTTLSDETMKDIIEPISNAVAKVGSLRSVIGKFKTDDSNKRRSFLIAQDVQFVLPEAVDVVGENNELGLRYTEVIPLLVAAIKELTAEVNALKNA